jgi:hypothetical protein
MEYDDVGTMQYDFMEWNKDINFTLQCNENKVTHVKSL